MSLERILLRAKRDMTNRINDFIFMYLRELFHGVNIFLMLQTPSRVLQAKLQTQSQAQQVPGNKWNVNRRLEAHSSPFSSEVA